MKKISLEILGIILFIGGIISTIYAIIMQMVLCYQKFGVIVYGDTTLIIPDKSLLGFLGIIVGFVGWIIIGIANENSHSFSEE